jgi:hypothetical protein
MPWPAGYALGRLIDPVYFHAKDTRAALLAKFENSVPDFTVLDPRVYALRGIQLSLQYAQLNCRTLQENVANPDWWPPFLAGPATQTNFEAAVDSYNLELISGLAYLPFVHFEAEIRRLVPAVDERARPADSFKNVYCSLFARLSDDDWTASRQEAESFLDIYRLVRNALLHTHGILYLHPGERDLDLTWRGVTYRFRHGQVFEEADDAEFVLELIRELIDLTDSIMRAPLVAELPAID